jgi:osmotically-inducible protein OsmY
MSVRVLALVICLSAWPLMVGLTGCTGDRYNQSTGYHFDDNLAAEFGYNASAGQRIEDNRAAERGHNQSTDQRIEDRRMAERVREALAAAPEYKFDGVQVAAFKGVVHLSGFVNTSAQRHSAGEVTSKVVGVKSVENNLTVKE